MSERDQLRDLQQAADYLGVSKRTLYREHRRGRISFVKLGGQTRVWQSELDRYLRDATLVA